MYTVNTKGINIRETDRDVADGFLQESINMQWRDGACRPIPERLSAQIDDPDGSLLTVLHKVDDEDVINVLMFTSITSGRLYWYGSITNGVYQALPVPISIADFPQVTDFDSLSYTILNGLIYFMSTSQEFYYRVQYDQVENNYEAKDLYAWKSLIPFFPFQDEIDITYDLTGLSGTNNTLVRCGYVSIRFALVLKTGEVVLHSPSYIYLIYGFNRYTDIEIGDAINNIHSFINLDLEFANNTLFEDNISAINVYASIPFYYNTFETDNVTLYTFPIDFEDLRSIGQEQAEQPFYLIKTIQSPTSDKILLHADNFDFGRITYNETATKINMDTIAAGEVMPVDNFSYHSLFGNIKSNNGRLIIDKPKTVMSEGHMRSLATLDTGSDVGFEAATEDGNVKGISFSIDKNVEVTSGFTYARGILSYPDGQGTFVGANGGSGNLRMYKTRRNVAHNMSCAFNFNTVVINPESIVEDSGDLLIACTYSAGVAYDAPDKEEPINNIASVSYASENRIQFSESGEFSVWPVINSYRVGEGKILFVGDNSIDPANMDYIAPLLIGSTDGVYTVNFDVTGASLVQSITKAANMPALSSENIQIDQSLIYVSDKGLMAINSGQLINLTRDYFPEYGNGNFPNQESIYPNYTLLTEDFMGANNPYVLDDIVNYMKGAIFAYDGRRNNLWCCNPNENFSLIYNLSNKQWDMSTYLFAKRIEFFSILDTAQGDVYSRYLVVNGDDVIDILSGENPDIEVETHLLTRPIKMLNADSYKKIQRLISRCELYRDTNDGYFTFGLWGKQDINKNKVNIPLVAFKDDSTEKFPDDIRQDIPVGRQKGKYKTITILQGGKFLPGSSVHGFDIAAILLDNNILR